jgi:hypothetical protein
MNEGLARPERFEPPTLCLEVLGFEILNALSSVAYGRQNSKTCPQLGYMGYKLGLQRLCSPFPKGHLRIILLAQADQPPDFPSGIDP